MRVLVILSFLLLAASTMVHAINNRPVIGIVTQPSFSSLPKHTSYIAASYIKYVEGAGAQAIPIFHDSTKDELKAVFSEINGLLFPGGDISPSHSLYQSAKYLVELAMEANDKGDIFPIHATCQGFQLLSVIFARDDNLLTQFDSENYPIPLDVTSLARSSPMFAAAPVWNALTKLNSTMNNHHWGVAPEQYEQNPGLSQNFDVLSVNADRNGRIFVSTALGKKYPFMLLQWHPEKNQYEFTVKENIPHDGESVLAMQYMANYFVGMARKSMHKFVSQSALDKAVIYNYSPLDTTSFSSFNQCYVFPLRKNHTATLE